MTLIFIGCNPFAPEHTNFEDSIVGSDRTTIAGLMESFEFAYTFKDSFLYEELLDSSFVFKYNDNGVYVTWNRDEDITITKRMFRSLNDINLEFNSFFPEPDSLVNDITYIASFTLMIRSGNNEDIFTGHAKYSYKREDNFSNWTIYRWEDLK